jgi:LPXTG-motif cell wall-anchored protein
MNLSREVVRGVVRGGTMFVVGLLTFASFGLNGASASNGTWGEPTPAEFASGAQNINRSADFFSVSCASAGNCTAVGYFSNTDGYLEAVAMSSSNGVWGQATPAVFASGLESTGEYSVFRSVSCASAGNCTAVGSFQTAAGGFEAFTMTSSNGVWGDATPPTYATGARNYSLDAEFVSVSCASAGNCTAVGYFTNVDGYAIALTMTSTNGAWGQATPAVFASGVMTPAPYSAFDSVSCASAGNCTAGGAFRPAAGGFGYKSFYMTSTDGVWGQATPVAFADGVQRGSPEPESVSVSCASVGNCTVVGAFRNSYTNYYLMEAFTMSSTNGVWGLATPVTFADGIQSTFQRAVLNSVSCASAGNCTAAGTFKTAVGGFEAFTVTSTNGVWGQATPAIHATGARDNNRDAEFYSVSCASAGNCTAVGYFNNSVGGFEAFTLTSTNGVWGQATPAVFASGVQSLTPNAYFNAVSCASAGNCTAVGRLRNAVEGFEAFTMRSTYNPPATTTTTMATQVAALPATGSRSDGWLVAGMFTVIAGTVLSTRRRRIS